MFMIMAGMDPCILLWVILLIAFVVGELITVGLTSIWFAAGSLVALLAAALGANPVVQVILFLAVAVGLLAATRPWAKKYINARTQRTNADRVIGETIRIAERVSNLDLPMNSLKSHLNMTLNYCLMDVIQLMILRILLQ